MLISDANKFIFIHIPKCAGTSLRKSILKVDPNTIKINYVDIHSELGKLDYTHIPLKELHDYFPTEWNKILKYNTLACVRDPFQRFPSSLAQKLRMYKGCEIRFLTSKKLAKEVDEVIKTLSILSSDNVLPAEMIHFQKQVCYIFHGNQQIVKTVIDVSQVEVYIAQLFNNSENHIFSNPLTPHKLNATMRYKIDFYRNLDQYILDPIYKNRIGQHSIIKRGINKIKKWIMSPYSDHIDPIFQSDTVRDFIQAYYYDDLIYIEGVRKQNPEFINAHVQ
jgi:hypothetical protein